MPSLSSLPVAKLSFGFLLLAAASAHAATDPSALTLKQAYQAALTRSETLASQQELVVQAEEHAKQARGSILPGVNGVASYFKQALPDGRPASSLSPSSQITYKLTASQPLFRGLREFAALRRANRLSEAQESTRKQAELLLFDDVAQAYLTVASLEQDLKNLEEERGLFEKRIGELHQRVKIGRSRNTEVLTLDATLQTVLAQDAQTRGNLQIARETLAFLTGLPDSTPISGAPDALPIGPNAVAAANQDTIEARPDVQAARLRSQAADEGIWIAKGAHLPSLDWQGNYYFRRSGATQEGIDWDFTFALTIPIFAGGVTQSYVREAASINRQAELDLTRSRRAADEELRSLAHAVASDRDQIESLRKVLESSSRNYESETRDYRLGLVTNLDVLQTLSASQEAKRNLDKLRYQAHLDFIKLQTASGKMPDVSF